MGQGIQRLAPPPPRLPVPALRRGLGVGHVPVLVKGPAELDQASTVHHRDPKSLEANHKIVPTLRENTGKIETLFGLKQNRTQRSSSSDLPDKDQGGQIPVKIRSQKPLMDLPESLSRIQQTEISISRWGKAKGISEAE